MKRLDIVIQNRTGLHARPAKVLVKLAKQFKSEIRIHFNQKRADAKSMVSVLTLGATCGSSIVLETLGEDEELALTQIAAAFQAGLGDREVLTDAAGDVSAPEPGEPGTRSILRGIAASPGIAIGPLFQFRPQPPSLRDRMESPGGVTLSEALSLARQQLASLQQRMLAKQLSAEASIFEAQSELLEDIELKAAVQASILAGESPVRAWQTAIEARAAEIGSLGDRLLSARADDLRDVGRRVLELLLGTSDQGSILPDTPVVILAGELRPSQVASFDPERVLGLGCVHGGPTSHIAILARALGLPAVVGIDETALALRDNTLIVLNGNDGTLVLDPDSETLGHFRQAQQLFRESGRNAQSQAGVPALTRDGRRVEVMANAGSIAQAGEALLQGADGIGLLRTEFLFLDRRQAPDEDEQFQAYRTIAETMNPRPVVIRTLDIGGDKPVPYLPMEPEANPFLGRRGIRFCLSHPELFREQLRAILRAASPGHLQILFPMISDVSELRQVRAKVDELRRETGVPAIPIGVMIEVPSAALLADQLALEADFFSIGTNDLTQYTLAMDRGHADLAAQYDGLHPAVLRLIAMTTEAAHKRGKRVDVCGELGSDAAAIPILIGLGVDELSVSIPFVPRVKAQVRTLDYATLQPLVRQALDCSTALAVRNLVQDFVS